MSEVKRDNSGNITCGYKPNKKMRLYKYKCGFKQNGIKWHCTSDCDYVVEPNGNKKYLVNYLVYFSGNRDYKDGDYVTIDSIIDCKIKFLKNGTWTVVLNVNIKDNDNYQYGNQYENTFAGYGTNPQFQDTSSQPQYNNYNSNTQNSNNQGGDVYIDNDDLPF